MHGGNSKIRGSLHRLTVLYPIEIFLSFNVGCKNAIH